MVANLEREQVSVQADREGVDAENGDGCVLRARQMPDVCCSESSASGLAWVGMAAVDVLFALFRWRAPSRSRRPRNDSGVYPLHRPARSWTGLGQGRRSLPLILQSRRVFPRQPHHFSSCCTDRVHLFQKNNQISRISISSTSKMGGASREGMSPSCFRLHSSPIRP